jgi:hypothetical protein
VEVAHEVGVVVVGDGAGVVDAKGVKGIGEGYTLFKGALGLAEGRVWEGDG